MNENDIQIRKCTEIILVHCIFIPLFKLTDFKIYLQDNGILFK